jgi:putative heme transporter
VSDEPGPANGQAPVPAGATRRDDDEMPRMGITRERAIVFAIFVLSAVAFLYFVLPKLAGLHKTWNRLQDGQVGWLIVAAGLEVLSFLSYMWLFRTVFIRGKGRIGWKESYEITMAGLAATRLFAAAGAGGVALTAWAVRKSGMERRLVAARMIAFMSLLYTVYVVAVVICGILLRTGVLHGEHPFGFTIIPSLIGIGLLMALVAIAFVPKDIADRLQAGSDRRGRGSKLLARLALAPASIAAGAHGALGLIRAREPGVLGAIGWWLFDIGVLWACFHAFGEPPPFGVIVMCYFIGMVANTLPLPGGIGGVDGGMIGTFIAFGVDPGLALVSVLAYRAFSFWLPTIPGAIAYFQLRRTVARWGDTISNEATPRTETVNV